MLCYVCYAKMASRKKETYQNRWLYLLNEHNIVFATKRSAICNMSFLGPTRVLNANGILIASSVFARPTR